MSLQNGNDIVLLEIYIELKKFLLVLNMSSLTLIENLYLVTGFPKGFIRTTIDNVIQRQTKESEIIPDFMFD